MQISFGIIKHISHDKKNIWFGLHRYSATIEGKIQIISYEAPMVTGNSIESITKQVEKILRDINDCPVILIEKSSALATEDYFQTRANRASKVDFDEAMSKVKRIRPEKGDSL